MIKARRMLFTFLLTVIGSSLGGILALGTAWTTVKRYFQRTLARHLSEIIPSDMSTAVVLASHHAGKEKAKWIVSVLTKSELLKEDSTTVLDLAGATHFDLLDELIPIVKEVQVYDGKIGVQYLAENRAALLTTGKLNLRQGENIKGKLVAFADAEVFDVVLAIDILHAIRPDQRHETVTEWARLVKPVGGAIVVVFETEPLSTVSEAGIIQGIFFRANYVAVKGLLESIGFGKVVVYEFPEDNRMAIVGIKGKSTPIQDKSWSQQ